MSLESQVADLVVATTELTRQVVVAKSSLDDAVTSATTAKTDAETAKATATQKAEAAATSATAAATSKDAADADAAATEADRIEVAANKAGTANDRTAAAASALAAANSATLAGQHKDAAANSATAAALATNAPAWVSGTTYKDGDVRYSTLDRRIYRRITNGAGTVDPSADSANWSPMTLDADTGLPDVAPAFSARFDLGLIPSDVTFARNSEAMRKGKTGAYEKAPVNMPRIEYDAATAKPIGLLVERPATNLIRNSSMVGASASGVITAFSRVLAGDGYTSFPTVTISPPEGGGTQATAVVSSMLALGVAAVDTGGTGYAVGDVLTPVGGTGGTGTRITVSSVSNGVITGASVTVNGPYTALPANPVSVSGGTGSGAKFNLKYAVGGLSLTNAGSGYTTSAPVVTITGGGGFGANAFAMAGVLPTNYGFGGNGGISVCVLGTGIEKGINYVDLRFTGKVTSANGEIYLFPELVRPSAAPNKTFTASYFAKVIGGTLNGVITSEIYLIGIKAGVAMLEAGATQFNYPVNKSLDECRFFYTRKLTHPDTNIVETRIDLNVTTGVDIDVTLRIGMPNLVESEILTSPIPSTTSAALRNADSAIIQGEKFTKLFNPTQGTFVVEFDLNTLGSNYFPGVFAVGDDAGNTLQVCIADTSDDRIFFTIWKVVDGVSIRQCETRFPIGAIKPNSKYKFSISYSDNGVTVGCGGTVTTYPLMFSGRNFDTYKNIRIGVRSGGNDHLGGHITQFDYYPVELTKAEHLNVISK